MSAVTAKLGATSIAAWVVEPARARISWIVLAISCVCVFSSAAQGQENPEGRIGESVPSTSPDYDTVLDRALDAFDAREYARARVLFEQAYAIRPNARVLRGLGISALQLERFSLSKRELTQALEETKQPLTLTQREGVKELLSWMQLNLGTLRLQLQPAHAHVLVDDQPVDERELVLKPGAHRLHVSADRFVSHAQTVEVDAGETKTLAVSLEREPVEDAPTASVVEPGTVMSAFFVGSGGSRRMNDDRTGSEAESETVFERWWFWAAVGVVIAGGLVTTVALTADEPAKKYESGGLGGVLRPLEWRP